MVDADGDGRVTQKEFLAAAKVNQLIFNALMIPLIVDWTFMWITLSIIKLLNFKLFIVFVFA
jgi:hypothetical protein